MTWHIYGVDLINNRDFYCCDCHFLAPLSQSGNDLIRSVDPRASVRPFITLSHPPIVWDLLWRQTTSSCDNTS